MVSFVLFLIEYSKKRQLIEARVCFSVAIACLFSLQFQVRVRHNAEVKAGTCNSWSHHNYRQDQRVMNAPILIYLCSTWFLSLYTVQDPCLGNGTAYCQLDLPMSLNLINRIPHSHNHRSTHCKQPPTETLAQ